MASKARLFYPDKIKTGNISRLSEKQSHYTKNVMRLKAGDKISLFNSQDGEWDAKITNQGKIFTEFKVEKLSRPLSKENNIWLAFSPIKKVPQDLMIQKTTELGIQKFIPLLCERSVVREINIKRAEKIITEACEQSNRITLPKILNLQKLNDFVKNFPDNGKIIFCDINSNSKDLKNKLTKINPICILIGPEGDFSEEERQFIINKKNVISITLAKNILRAETAAIASTTILNYNLENN
jgi:16S rRNA (uracil1498-N3)-methyltransferase